MCIERVGSWPRTPSGCNMFVCLTILISHLAPLAGCRPATIRSSIHVALLTEGHPDCREEFCKRLFTFYCSHSSFVFYLTSPAALDRLITCHPPWIHSLRSRSITRPS